MVKKMMTFMNLLKFRGVPSIALFVVLMALAPRIYAAYNFARVELRTDVLTVTRQPYMDYKHSIYIKPYTNPNGDSSTNFWIALFDPDTPNISGNIQVGYRIMGDGTTGMLQWFVYTEASPPSINCWQGTPIINSSGVTYGCMGVIGHWVQVNSWLDVQIVTYSGQPWWIVRIYNQNGSPIDVAKVSIGLKQVVRAKIQTDMQSPYLGDFYHYNPRQKTSYAPVDFQTWPLSGSTGNPNYLTTYLNPNNICGTDIGTSINLLGLGYYWRTWKSGTTCSANPLF